MWAHCAPESAGIARLRRNVVLAVVGGTIAWPAGPRVQAQSTEPATPTRLQRGGNHGSLDSLRGQQSWDVEVNPGSFQIVLSGAGPQQGLTPANAPAVTVDFLAEQADVVLKHRAIPLGGVVYTGTVVRRTRMRVTVTPVRGPQRTTTEYTLVVSGDVEF